MYQLLKKWIDRLPGIAVVPNGNPRRALSARSGGELTWIGLTRSYLGTNSEPASSKLGANSKPFTELSLIFHPEKFNWKVI